MMLKKIKETICRYGMLTPGETVVVAVSGGPDSVAMLSVLHNLSADFRLSLVVAHLDHALRPASSEEAAFVKNMAENLNWPSIARRVDVADLSRKMKTSLEDAARAARYDFLQEAASRYGAKRIALGHHRGDQAETVLMNVIRGSGADGLKGMLPVREGLYIRPLLFTGRDEILDYLRKSGFAFVVDASNDSDAFLRNRIRRRLLPVLRSDFNPRIDDALGRLAEIIRLEDDFMTTCEEEILTRWGITPGSSPVLLNTKDFLALHEAIQNRMIKRLLERFCPQRQGIASSHILSVHRLIQSERPSGALMLPSGIRVRRDYERVVMSCAAADAAPTLADFCYEVPVPGEGTIVETGQRIKLSLFSGMPAPAAEWGKNQASAWMDYDRLHPPLTIRNFRPGDRMRCLGMEGTKKIKDIFIDEKIPREKRRRLPLLADSRDILWIAGLRCAEKGRITAQTKRILKAEII